MPETVAESLGAWLRLGIFAILVIILGAAAGFATYRYSGQTDAATVAADSQTLSQVQQKLTDLDKRIDDMETRRRTEPPRVAADPKAAATTASPASAQPTAKPRYQVSPASALPAAPAAPPRSPVVSGPDPATAQKLASLQQGLGALQDQTKSNDEAWQATTNRLADVAGELSTQHGQILQNQDELHQYLDRAQHKAITFELRRSSVPEAIGPVRLSLKAANQKSKRYTLCVYMQADCVEVRDRVLYEVVQLAVSHDTAPIELIATEVGKDGIVGYVEVAADGATAGR